MQFSLFAVCSVLRGRPVKLNSLEDSRWRVAEAGGVGWQRHTHRYVCVYVYYICMCVHVEAHVYYILTVMRRIMSKVTAIIAAMPLITSILIIFA